MPYLFDLPVSTTGFRRGSVKEKQPSGRYWLPESLFWVGLPETGRCAQETAYAGQPGVLQPGLCARLSCFPWAAAATSTFTHASRLSLLFPLFSILDFPG